MKNDEIGVPRNYRRRSIGVFAFLFPFMLIACSILGKPFSIGILHIPLVGASTFLMVFALFITSLNLYLTVIRPLLFRHREDYHYASGAPIIGTLLVIVGTIVGWSSVRTGVLGLIVLLLDTGGIPYFITATWWRDPGFWDSP